jgi:transmembrane sensor
VFAKQTPPKSPRGCFGRAFAYAGGGLATAIALSLAMPLLQTRQQAVMAYHTDVGQTRTVALGNGINVTLSPASSLIVRGQDARQMELASGEAFFDVRHDPARSLTISAGRYSISDIGTRFSVTLGGQALRVGVAQGSLAVHSSRSGQSVQISAGHQLLAERDDLTLAPVASGDIGSWRSGRLSYSGVPMGLVAADISRYSGKAIVVAPSLETTHFSGTLVIGDGSRLLSDLAAVMELRIQTQGDRVHIAAAAR